MEIEKRKEYKNRWIILAVLVLLPFIVDMYSIQLIIICYLITIVSTILFFGRLGDIKGKSMVFNLGLLVFTMGSLFCGLSKSFTSLVFFRIIQAIGASAAMANNQGIITQVFPANERGKALGISGTFLALGTMIGPPLGGDNFIFKLELYIFYKYSCWSDSNNNRY